MSNILIPKSFRDVAQLERELHKRPEKYWMQLGDKRALGLFQQMAGRVPAYQDFLKKNGVNSKKIKTIKDFRQLPTVDKDNYLRAYSLEKLCWDGEFKTKSWTISTTSGSTGKPFYFPRQADQDQQYAITAELYLRSNFEIHRKSTLYIVAFPMGAWIGGVFTYQALKIVAESGKYQLSIITPGIHKKEILDAVKQLGKNFDQILIGSYAPFLKDILDDGEAEGINWKEYNLGFIFSAEGFSEIFRDYVVRKTGLDNPYKDTLNHYGTVDLGTMAHETPLSILLRRQALQNLNLYKTLFYREDKLPTFAQYNPALFYFEADEGNLYCSAYSGLPLVRYDLKDSGGVSGLGEVKTKLKGLNMDLDNLVAKNNLQSTVWNLPFVYIYERNDFSVSFFAFQIYPEMIRRAMQSSNLEKDVTSKFSMSVVYDDSGQQKLQINIELKSGRRETKALRERIKQLVTESLLTDSSEYRETHKLYGEKVYPQIILWPYEDATYFKPGIKQKWVVK